MTEWLKFIAMAAIWSLACGALLEVKMAHPAAVGLVWIVGFLWFTGWIIEGRSGGDNLVKYTAGMFGGLITIAAVGVGIVTLLGG